MLFNSYIFVLLFLPVVLMLWWSTRIDTRTRLCMLVAASYCFYGWWDFRFVGLLVLSTLVDYYAGLQLVRATTLYGKRLALLVSMSANLGLLGYFKYSGFLARSVNAVTDACALGQVLPVWDIVLPVGISFYTFQTMSYTIDLYRGIAQPAVSLLHFSAYVSMFPQLVAGPIVRYSDIEDQLRTVPAQPNWPQMAHGVYFFAAGLGQKLLLADVISRWIDPLLADHQSLQCLGSWFAMLGYTCQLYFDFAGYSNMAVGLGLLLGFQFPQNFDSPYRAENIASFWRRWHITLSTWLRDYLFLPLGGSRGSRWLTLRNLMIVMLLGGLWHGAGWTFIVWGLYHGTLLVLHRLAQATGWRPWPRGLAVAVTFLSVVVGWVFFRATDMTMAVSLLSAMSGLRGLETQWRAACGGPVAAASLAAMLLGIFAFTNVWQIRFRPDSRWALIVARLLLVCILRFDSQSPFLYFQF